MGGQVFLIIINVDNNSQDTPEKERVPPERAEEAKLKAKYPNLGQKPGGSDFLMKRLQKGVNPRFISSLKSCRKGEISG